MVFADKKTFQESYDSVGHIQNNEAEYIYDYKKVDWSHKSKSERLYFCLSF